MSDLAIFGAGGHGRVVADTALLAGYNSVTLYDDAWPSLRKSGAWHVEGDFQTLLGNLEKHDGVLVAIGNNYLRLQLEKRCFDNKISLISLCHPSAIVAKDVTMGPGSVVFAGAVIQPGAVIGRCCVVNTGANIDHDCVLENGVHICPGVTLAGGVHVGDLSWVGIGASVIQNKKIGNNVIVGAGAVVISNVPDGITVVGVPARPII